MTYQEHFLSVWPEEGCGYIKDDVFYPLENIAQDKLHTFEVDPSFLIEEPDSFIHSHPVGVYAYNPEYDARSPSKEDLTAQAAMDLPWAICITDGETVGELNWFGDPSRYPPLEGREFIHNLYDCFSLVQAYFHQKFRITVPTVPRTPYWNEEADGGFNHILDEYEKCGFVLVDLNREDAQPHDVLIYTVASAVPNHLGILLPDGEVLSHWYNRASAIEPYGKWQKWITHAVRHKTLRK